MKVFSEPVKEMIFLKITKRKNLLFSRHIKTSKHTPNQACKYIVRTLSLKYDNKTTMVTWMTILPLGKYVLKIKTNTKARPLGLCL